VLSFSKYVGVIYEIKHYVSISIVTHFHLQFSSIFIIYAKNANACGEVKPISSGGLKLLASHFASVNCVNALYVHAYMCIKPFHSEQ